MREGAGDVCVLAVGKMVANALKAASLLADEGVDVTVWDVRVVKPLDPVMLADAAATGWWSRSRTASPRAASAR